MEIIPGIHRVDDVNGNCYLIVRDRLTLIDTGLPRNSKKILRYIENTLKRTPSDLATIILTHYHIDHTGNVSELKKLTGPVLQSTREMQILYREKNPTLCRREGWVCRSESWACFSDLRVWNPTSGLKTVTLSPVLPAFTRPVIHPAVSAFLIRKQTSFLWGIS